MILRTSSTKFTFCWFVLDRLMEKHRLVEVRRCKQRIFLTPIEKFWVKDWRSDLVVVCYPVLHLQTGRGASAPLFSKPGVCLKLERLSWENVRMSAGIMTVMSAVLRISEPSLGLKLLWSRCPIKISVCQFASSLVFHTPCSGMSVCGQGSYRHPHRGVRVCSLYTV